MKSFWFKMKSFWFFKNAVKRNSKEKLYYVPILGHKYINFFGSFFRKNKTLKSHFEINWPLTETKIKSAIILQFALSFRWFIQFFWGGINTIIVLRSCIQILDRYSEIYYLYSTFCRKSKKVFLSIQCLQITSADCWI